MVIDIFKQEEGKAKSLQAIAASLKGCRFVNAEFMYKPRPDDPRWHRVFDFTLQSRLEELCRYPDSAVIWLCADHAVINSLEPITARFPSLKNCYLIVNPPLLERGENDTDARTPWVGRWHAPETWHPYMLTDRWSRILTALEIGQGLGGSNGWLIMPAHDAVWGKGLLPHLARLSVRYSVKDIPSAVSPYTPYQHSPIQGVDIPHSIVEMLNTAFGRDLFLRWRIARGHYQAFWGKMGIIPFRMCGEILQSAETRVWEDDLEIDRVVREASLGAHCSWISNPDLYRQALPVFDEDGVRAVIDRTLHYSMNLPGKRLGDKSLLTQPLPLLLRARARIDGRYRRALDQSERLIQSCLSDAEDRIRRTGMSWVDWGAYRYVVRVGDPFVQVWKAEQSMI